jgi:hypothetical protein
MRTVRVIVEAKFEDKHIETEASFKDLVTSRLGPIAADCGAATVVVKEFDKVMARERMKGKHERTVFESE